jgi:hypothetical protein
MFWCGRIILRRKHQREDEGNLLIRAARRVRLATSCDAQNDCTTLTRTVHYTQQLPSRKTCRSISISMTHLVIKVMDKLLSIKKIQKFNDLSQSVQCIPAEVPYCTRF